MSLYHSSFFVCPKSPSSTADLNVNMEKPRVTYTSDESSHGNGPTHQTPPVTADPQAEATLLRKLDFAVVPILFLLFFFAFLDRINIGNAKVQGLDTDLRLEGNQFNIALLIFFVPYIVFEVPSNIALKRLSPSTWLSVLTFGVGKSHLRLMWVLEASCS